MRFIKLAICILLFGGLSASCTKEDHSDCYNTYRLAFRYNGDGTEDIFSQKIGSVDMYVFDANSNLVASGSLSQAEIQAQEKVLPPLEEGEYRIVCVGNAYDTEVQGLSSKDLSEMTFSAKDYLNGEIVSGNDSLYWSAINYTILPYSEYKMEETRTTYFASSHYDIYVEIINAPSVVGEEIKIELVNVSPLTDFNNVAEGQATNYVLDAVKQSNTLITASANIMRHTNHEDVYLKVTAANGKVLAYISFAEHIKKYSKLIDTSLNECLIPFTIEFGDTSMDVEINFPSWIYEIVTPEF